MTINNCIYIILLTYSLQYYVLAVQTILVSRAAIQTPNIAAIERENSGTGIRLDIAQRSAILETDVDPNDHVDVEVWNKLNDADIKRMPQTNDYSSESAARKWLAWYFPVLERYDQVAAHLQWNYDTNITKKNLQAKVAQSLKASGFRHLSLPIAKKFNEQMKYSSYEDLKLIFFRLSQGTISQDKQRVKQVSKLNSELQRIYSSTQVCELNDKRKCYHLSPYLQQLMTTEKDYDRLLWAGKGWHNNGGNQIRPVYLQYIDLLNKEAKDNGHKDLAELWINKYEMGSGTEFEGIVDQILKDIMPLYTQLHAFVRGRLCELYPGRFDCNGPIPAHLVGSITAQEWSARVDDMLAYPDEPLVNLTRVLNKKRYTINRMYKTAEDFFTSINLYPMTPKFWARSMFTKPTDRNVICQPLTFDMNYHNDYRVRSCTMVNADYFYTVHHDMGLIEYAMAYAKAQPYVYRNGANSAFRDAVGDTIGMYAVSPAHLIKLDMVNKETITSNYEINYLMYMALQKVAFLPFAYAMDKYRFALFRNQINRHDQLNARWWTLRTQYTGIKAPVPRNDSENFDADAKYHIPSNVPYFKYFIAEILQFQFYRAMCKLQGQRKPLHMCDIYGNKHVGDRLKQMLAMGSSKPWSEILKSFTGEEQLEPQAMLDFFEPLYKWLKRENVAKGYPVGWR